MGVDLFGHGGLSMNWHGWRHCLDVAMAFGWEPEGTAPTPVDCTPDGQFIDDGPGTYFSNDFREVTEADAKQLSQALCRAIETVEHGHKLTPEQASVVKLDCVILWKRLAKYAGDGDFLIG